MAVKFTDNAKFVDHPDLDMLWDAQRTFFPEENFFCAVVTYEGVNGELALVFDNYGNVFYTEGSSVDVANTCRDAIEDYLNGGDGELDGYFDDMWAEGGRLDYDSDELAEFIDEEEFEDIRNRLHDLRPFWDDDYDPDDYE